MKYTKKEGVRRGIIHDAFGDRFIRTVSVPLVS